MSPAFDSFAALTVVLTLNHLLAGAEWARKRLAPFAGKTIGIACGRRELALAIREGGDFAPQAPAEIEAVSVRFELSPEAPRHLLAACFSGADDDLRLGLWRDAKISGDVAFADALNFVFRHLDWDVEADLARVTGDIVAHRLVRLGRAAQQRLAVQGQTIATAWFRRAEDDLATQTPFATFRQDLARLTTDLAALATRIDRLAARRRG